MVQLGDVVHLVEPVDDGLVAHRHIPLHHFVEHHVLHVELAQVGNDLGPDGVEQCRCLLRPGEVDPHPATPFAGGDRRRPHVDEMAGVEVVPLGHADQLAGGVVHPTVVRAGEATSPTALHLADDGGASVAAHVVERGERAVDLAGDDHRLAVPLVGDPVARPWHLFAAAGDEPVRGEHLAALGLELRGIGVRVATHPARAVVGDVLHPWAQSCRQITTTCDVHHESFLSSRAVGAP